MHGKPNEFTKFTIHAMEIVYKYVMTYMQTLYIDTKSIHIISLC